MENYNSIKMTENDIEILCKTLFGECRGETRKGQVGVCCVIFNRYLSTKKHLTASSIAKVCQKPWQFSCWNPSDPNAQKLLKITFPTVKKYISIISEALEGDITAGATHYCTKQVKNSTSWAKDKSPCIIIGNHEFFNNID